jgi:hypothetical protein
MTKKKKTNQKERLNKDFESKKKEKNFINKTFSKKIIRMRKLNEKRNDEYIRNSKNRRNLNINNKAKFNNKGQSTNINNTYEKKTNEISKDNSIEVKNNNEEANIALQKNLINSSQYLELKKNQSNKDNKSDYDDERKSPNEENNSKAFRIEEQKTKAKGETQSSYNEKEKFPLKAKYNPINQADEKSVSINSKKNEIQSKEVKNEKIDVANSIEEKESEYSQDSEDEIKSLGQLQMQRCHIKKEILIKHRILQKKDLVPLEKVKELFRKKKYEQLNQYKFPYMTICEFNNLIYPIDLNIIRCLFFYCPLCEDCLRHYSIMYHIFQNHFQYINEYLTPKQIANCCANIMQKEYQKIQNSLRIFSEVATIFNDCQFIGVSEWSYNARKEIEELKNIDIEKTYFSISVDEAKKSIEKKLPINKNKKRNRKYKAVEKKFLLKK